MLARRLSRLGDQTDGLALRLRMADVLFSGVLQNWINDSIFYEQKRLRAVTEDVGDLSRKVRRAQELYERCEEITVKKARELSPDYAWTASQKAFGKEF